MTRMALAGIEGQKAKRLLGSLRTLWRSSPSTGQDGKITHLKSCLLPSPEQLSRAGSQVELEQDPEPEPAEVAASNSSESGGDADCDADSAAAGSDAADADDADASDDDDKSRSQHELSQPDLSQHEPSPSQPELSQSDDSEPEPQPEKPMSPASSDSLNAPTEKLGSPSSPECVSSDPESCNDLILNALPDSQVEGAGWMGRGMMYWRDVEKKEKEKQGKELRINYMIDSIKHELCQTVSSTAIKTFWGEFRADLKKMVEKSDLSHDAFVKLSNPDIFIKWHAAQMQKDL